MTGKQRKLLKPPAQHKVRGLCIDDESSFRPELVKIVSTVKSDKTLDLQIRDAYLNIYYCGGSLLKISGFRGRSLSFKFDDKYFKRKNGLDEDKSWLPKTNDISLWLSLFDRLKKTMDGWFLENIKAERDLQQKLCSISTRNSKSPWIVLDVEYAAWLYGKRGKDIDKSIGRRLCRFDMIAIKREDLRSAKSLTAYLVEFKQGNNALNGSAGVESHARDFLQFIASDEDKNARVAFIHSVHNILKEKSELGLLAGVDTYLSGDDTKIKAMFLFCKSTIAPEILASTQMILSSHGATPLFWEMSESSLELVEYKQ